MSDLGKHKRSGIAVPAPAPRPAPTPPPSPSEPAPARDAEGALGDGRAKAVV